MTCFYIYFLIFTYCNIWLAYSLLVTAAQMFAIVLKWIVCACIGREVHCCIGSCTNLRLSFAPAGFWGWGGGCLTDGRRKTQGSEQRVVIRPGHLARARRALSSRRLLTRWQELQTARSFTPHRKVGRSIRPLSGRQIGMDGIGHQIKGSAVCCQAQQPAAHTSDGTHADDHVTTNWFVKAVKAFSNNKQ